MKPSWLQCWNQRLQICNLQSTLLPCPVSLWLSFLRTLPPPPTHAHISFATIKHSRVVNMLRKNKRLLAMAGQNAPQWEQEVPRGTDGKEAFGVTQTKAQSQLHHYQLGESRHVRSTQAVLPTSIYESIDKKMPSYRWLWEHRGSLPSNTIQETTSTCRVACGKCSLFYRVLVLGGVRWSPRTSLQFPPLGWGIQTLGASIILHTPFPALNVLLGAHFTFNFEDRKKTTLIVLRRMENGDSQWHTSIMCTSLRVCHTQTI